jgi:hypothetical protein
MTRITGIGLVLCVGGLGWLLDAGAAGEPGEFSRFVDTEGRIHLPNDFRAAMVHLGSWFVPDGEVSGFHNVYTEPSTVEAYRRTGEFPDGATLINEIRPSTTRAYTTGPNVSHANESIKLWFVMIKDRKGRFPGNPLWAEGWGWALIKPSDPSRNLATSFEASCQGCHQPARSNDWVYVEAYSTLREQSHGGEE